MVYAENKEDERVFDFQKEIHYQAWPRDNYQNSKDNFQKTHVLAKAPSEQVG